jgi:hypothetical protein
MRTGFVLCLLQERSRSRVTNGFIWSKLCHNRRWFHGTFMRMDETFKMAQLRDRNVENMKIEILHVHLNGTHQ